MTALLPSLARGLSAQLDAAARDYAEQQLAIFDCRPRAPRLSPVIECARVPGLVEALVKRGHERALVVGAWALIVERGEPLFRALLAERRKLPRPRMARRHG